MTIVEKTRLVVGGVDTHADVHVAAVVDHLGGVLGIETFDTTEAGYHHLAGWFRSYGPVRLVGVEGTGSYGAGLARHLTRAEIELVEVDRPNRQARYRDGKSDPLDAVAAARAALSGVALGRPKSRDGNVEAIRVLTVVRRSAVSERIVALNQLRHLCFTADPDPSPFRGPQRGPVDQDRRRVEASPWRRSGPLLDVVRHPSARAPGGLSARRSRRADNVGEAVDRSIRPRAGGRLRRRLRSRCET